MKKIPESFELDEEDIKEAIVDWLNKVEYYDSIDDVDFDITLTYDPSSGLTRAKAVKL
jgi:hypothetical protein